ncbi:MAG TPA: VanZ family protein [Candidatus Acidoferrum sp.]
MKKTPEPGPATWILPCACILFTAVLLVAGLWPFKLFPKNNVSWLPGQRGIELGGQGIIYSSRPFEAGQFRDSSFCSLTIRVQPRIVYLNNSGTMLAFYSAQNPEQFRLMQYHDELLIRKDHRDAEDRFKTVELELEHVFLRDEAVTFTVTAGPSGAVAYRNGVRAGRSARMRLTCADVAGQLVLGDSAVAYDPWRGKLFELAVYNQELTPQEVARAYAASGADSVSQDSVSNQGMLARYMFMEGAGREVHNSAGAGPNLIIPEVFNILHKKILMAPWEESRDKLTLRDIAINIFGFAPLGFLLGAYLARHWRWNRAVMITVIAGASISFTIEILQAIIPSRDSGVMDIFTNTFGTWLGVLLLRWPPLQAFANRWLIASPKSADHPAN